MDLLNQVLNSLQVIGLIPITGGTIVIGALIGPLMFQSLERTDASQLMIKIFTKFDKWIQTSAFMLLGSKLIQLFLFNNFNFYKSIEIKGKVSQVIDQQLVLSTVLILMIAAISLHIVNKVTPIVIEHYNKRRKNQSEEFEAAHRLSEQLHKLNFVLGTILLISFVV